MQEFVEFIIKQFVSKPEEVKVSKTHEENVDVYSIHVDKEDMGAVIGRDGRTINSIRNLAKAKAIKDNVMIRVVLEETNEPNATN